MYAKLFGSLLMSSIWSESQPTRILWITMMAAANREGEIFGSPIGLAATARLTLEETLAGLERLKSPEQHSSDRTRNPENEGRRIEEISGGWRLLNYVYYRELASAEERRAQWRESKRNLRAAKSTNVSDTSTLSRNVLPSESAPESTTTKKTRERERFAPPTLEEIRVYGRELPGLNAEAFFDFYASKGWKVGTSPMKDWKAAARRWRRTDAEAGKIKTEEPSKVDERKAQGERDAEIQRRAMAEIEKTKNDRIRYAELLKTDPAAAAAMREQIRRENDEAAR